MLRISATLLLMISTAYADVTGNLITNGDFDNGTTGWTLSGDAQRIGDCCPGGHDLEFGDSGSIEQSFNLINNSITQPMLDNGITLNSSVQVQNGECAVAGCWGGSGPADSFSIRLQIRDESNQVLATTTQERYDVTGINGEYFTDSITYTGTGSNIGNINISGTDSNSPANLGGANVDNISVTMTYDPTVLTAVETAIIATAFEEIEEVLTTIEPEELFIYEEFIVEEFIPFEEPTIVTEMFSEIYIQEVAIEEINTGVINVFTLEPPTELEISYEETIEEVPTEIESFEEIVEVREEAVEEITNTGGTSEQNQTIAGNSELEERSTGGEETSTTETRTAEANTETNRNVGSGEEVVAENNVGETVPDVSVADIQRDIENTVTSVDQILIATSQAVASIMSQGRNLDSYSNTNQNIFNNQLVIDGGSYVETRNYFDDRNIYAQATYNNDDPVKKYQDNIQKATDARIRAEEHLRRIRGY